MKNNKPKILLLDIETSPILASVWGLFDQTIPLNQINQDWFILAFSAKWLDDDKIMYYDQRNAKDIEDDRELLKKVWKLLDECDVVVGQNSNGFDLKRLNARFILNGMKPPSSYKKVDTVLIARKHFGFTSNKLEYLTDKLCKKYKKLKHNKYPGFELWKECLKGNKSAWNEMKLYNEYDVLSLEELYKVLQPWDNSINVNLYSEGLENVCSCGNNKFHKNGFYYTASGKFQRYVCTGCGAETHSPKNLLTKEKKATIRKRSVR